MLDNFEFATPPNIISAWKGHAKFAQWLVYRLQPKSIVELGVHFGFSYFCFCQTIKRFNIPCTAIAVDTWKGDYQNGLYDHVYWDKAYEDTCAINQEFASFSKLLRMTFDESLPFVPNNSVDLLHIDGCHEYKTVANDWDKWQIKLTDKAVILLHDTNVRNLDHFGVWKFFEELCKKEKYTFEFLHSHGLGVIARDISKIPELFNIDQSRTNELRKFFEPSQ